MSEKQRIDQKGPAILAPTAERQGAGMATPIGRNTQPVEQIQEDVRFPVKSMIATCLLGGAIAGTVIYNYTNGLFPFNKDEERQEGAASSSSGDTNAQYEPPPKELPQFIRTNKDLQMALEALNVKAQAEDFEKPGANGHFRGLSLEPLNVDGGGTPENFEYQWKGLAHNSINGIKQEEVIIATRRMLPNSSIRYVGLQPRAAAKSGDDPTIEYHYYHCDDRSSKELAQISIVTGGRDGTFYSINLLGCKKKK